MLPLDTVALARLPKWAQEHIRKFEREVARLNQKLGAMSGEKPTAIEIDPYAADVEGMCRRFVEPFASIRFTCGEGRFIDVRLKNKGVDVFADAFGRDSLVICPGAANHFHIGFAEVDK